MHNYFQESAITSKIRSEFLSLEWSYQALEHPINFAFYAKFKPNNLVYRTLLYETWIMTKYYKSLLCRDYYSVWEINQAATTTLNTSLIFCLKRLKGINWIICRGTWVVVFNSNEVWDIGHDVGVDDDGHQAPFSIRWPRAQQYDGDGQLRGGPDAQLQNSTEPSKTKKDACGHKLSSESPSPKSNV